MSKRPRTSFASSDRHQDVGIFKVGEDTVSKVQHLTHFDFTKGHTFAALQDEMGINFTLETSTTDWVSIMDKPIRMVLYKMFFNINRFIRDHGGANMRCICVGNNGLAYAFEFTATNDIVIIHMMQKYTFDVPKGKIRDVNVKHLLISCFEQRIPKHRITISANTSTAYHGVLASKRKWKNQSHTRVVLSYTPHTLNI